MDSCLQKRHTRGKKVEGLFSWVGWPRCENRWLRYDYLNEAAQAKADLLPQQHSSSNQPHRHMTPAHARLRSRNRLRCSPTAAACAVSPSPPEQPAPSRHVKNARASQGA